MTKFAPFCDQSDISDLVEELNTANRALDEAQKAVMRYIVAFAHYHVSNGYDDSCAACLLDLRDPIHKRGEMR